VQPVELLGEFQAPGALRFIRLWHEPELTRGYAGSVSQIRLDRQLELRLETRPAREPAAESIPENRRPSIQRQSCWDFLNSGPNTVGHALARPANPLMPGPMETR
jgi:hypothetical protein